MRAFAYRLTLAEVGPVTDPEFQRADPATRKLVLNWILLHGLKEKDADLAAGLDREGEDLTPVLPQTAKHRRSAMGPASPGAPALMPAYAVSRTRLLLTGETIDDGAEFWWKYDSHTGDSWGAILDLHRIGIGSRHTKRDVIGLSPQAVGRVRAAVSAKWVAFKAKGYTTVRVDPAAEAVPAPRIRVIGKTNFEQFTYGIGGSGPAESRQALNAGYSTGFFQRKPGEGLPAFGGPRTPRAPVGPWGGSPPTGGLKPKPKPKPKPAAPVAKPTPPPAPAPKPKPAPVGKPVGESITVTAQGRVGQAVRDAVKAAESVHGVGTAALPPVPIAGSTSKRENGSYERTGAGVPVAIRVSTESESPGLTALHEIGHYFDFSAIPGAKWGDGKRFGYAADPLFAEWYQAATGSEAVQTLKAVTEGSIREYVDYLLRPDELWARSYAQYVATRSEDPALGAELAAEVGRVEGKTTKVPVQWTLQDFQPILRAIDALMQSMGWRT